MRRAETTILVLLLLGMLLSMYALSLHYKDGASTLCNIGETFNCDKVNKSPWSTFLGIPVALLGLLAYGVLALLTVQRARVMHWLAFTRKDYATYLLLYVMLMAGFQLYLTATEFLFIRAYCIVCLLNQAVIIALLGLYWNERRKV